MTETVYSHEAWDANPKIKRHSYDLVATALDLVGLDPTEKLICNMTGLIRTNLWTRKETNLGNYKITIERIK